jgi:hypothetical protein
VNLKSTFEGREEWLDFTPQESSAFAQNGKEKRQIPSAVFQKLAFTTLKDSVRGQCSAWRNGALQSGGMSVERIDQRQGTLTMRLTGSADLRQNGRACVCQLRGLASYDKRQRKFTRIKLAAAGQRAGMDRDDLGPAPMGVVFQLPE